ncbi:hypothetical protein K9N50_09180 [bacterium]|nr:hypothetical protein [bacterium]
MNALLIIALLLPLVLAGVILIPRVRFSGEVGAELKRVRIKNIWFLAEMDFQSKKSFLKVLFFRIRSSQEEDEARTDQTKTEYIEHLEPEETIFEPDLDEIFEEPAESVDEPILDEIQPSEITTESAYPKPKKQLKIKFKRKPKKKKTKTEERSIPWSLFWQECDLLWVVIKRIMNSMRRLLKTPHLDLFRVKLDIASPEPALTGLFFSAASQLKAFEKPPQRQFIINYDFNSEIPSGELKLAVSIRPIKVVYESLYMALRLPWIKIYKVYRKFKKSRIAETPDSLSLG